MATKTKKGSKSTSVIVSKKTLTERINDKISKKHSLNKNQIEAVLTEYLEETKSSLVKGEEIRLVGFYTLKTTTQKARTAMNLQTKKKMTIPAKKVPKVKFSDALKAEIAKSKGKK